MAYLGRGLDRGNYLKLDDISSQFNGSTTTFNLTSGGTAFYPGSAFSILVSVAGVIQEPESAYQINQSQIIFAIAPQASDDFFCIVLGVALAIGVPGEGTVTGSKFARPFNYDDGLLYLDDTNDRVGIGTINPSQRLQVGAASTQSFVVTSTGSVGIGTTNPNALLQVGAATTQAFIVTQVDTAVSVGIGTTNPGATLNVVPTSTSIAGLFSGTTSSDMVRITQLGSGNALVVEDSDNPDATPFVVRADGTVGIGTTIPLGTLQVNSGTSAVVVTSTGSVGIGTTNPLGQLQVGSGATVGSGNSVFIVSGIGSVGVGTTNPRFQMHIVGVGTTALFVVGESQLTRVAITTTSLNALTLEAGRTYIYYAPTTLTLPLSPTAGDRIEVINRSGVTTAVLARNGQSIMGLAENLDLDVIDGAFTVTYSNVTDGWVIGR